MAVFWSASPLQQEQKVLTGEISNLGFEKVECFFFKDPCETHLSFFESSTQSLFLVEPLHIAAVGAVLYSLQSISDLPGLAISWPSHVQNLMMAMNMQSGNQANQCSSYQCGVRAALTSRPIDHRLRAGTTKQEEIANLISSDTFLLMIRSQKGLLIFCHFSFSSIVTSHSIHFHSAVTIHSMSTSEAKLHILPGLDVIGTSVVVWVSWHRWLARYNLVKWSPTNVSITTLPGGRCFKDKDAV